MTNKIFQKTLLVFCVIFLAGCAVQTPVPVPAPTSIPLPTATALPSPTPMPTFTPFPATRLEIGVEGMSIQPNVLDYLINDHPAFSDSLFQTATHPGLFKVDPINESLEPVIADSPPGEWIKMNGALEQTVAIKPGMKWSDGSSLTADDIIYSYNLLRDIAALHLGSNQEIILASSMEVESTGQVKFIINSDFASISVNQTLLTFPILQKNFWGKYTIQLFENQNAGQLKTVAADFDQLVANRIQQEQEMNILVQQISDTRILMNNKQSKVGDLRIFINGRNAPHNNNGMKDGEDLVRANQVIGDLWSEIAVLRNTLDSQASQLDGLRTQIDTLIQHQQGLQDEKSGLVEKITQSFSDMDLGAEPLALPYRINAKSANLVEINALTNQESSPNLISFQAIPNDEIATDYLQGSLDAVFPYTGMAFSTDIQPTGVSDVTAIMINPVSDKMVYPVLGQAVACIYLSPDLWEDSSLVGSITLQAYQALPESQPEQPGCSGSLKTRLLYMRMLLDKSFFTWKFLKNGNIIPGSMKDPQGMAISPLTLSVDPDIHLPPDVQEKLTISLKKLGVDIIISQLPAFTEPSADQSVDMLLTHWKTSLPVSDQLCSLATNLGYSSLPVHIQTSLLETCGVSIAPLSPPNQSTPTPLILPSGKEAGTSITPQAWVILLSSKNVYSFWNPESVAKYDLAWLVSLAPSWTLAW